MKNCGDIKDICEEYCEDCVIRSSKEVAALIECKYLEDLEKRLNAHFWILTKKKKKYFLCYVVFSSLF